MKHLQSDTPTHTRLFVCRDTASTLINFYRIKIKIKKTPRVQIKRHVGIRTLKCLFEFASPISQITRTKKYA